MSAIYGIVAENRLSDVEASAHFLKRQYDERYKGDRSGVWRDRRVAVGAFEQWITSEEKRTPQPYSFGDAFVVVADAMLDYREELAEKLGLTLTNQTDVELIALAYNLWGRDCAKEFYGPFAIAVYDRRTNEVVLFRDRFGERSICYIEHEGTFAFSTIPKPLARLFDRAINEEYIKNYIAVPFKMKGYNIYSAQWESIFYLPPGSVAVWNGHSTSLTCYWKYDSVDSSVAHKREEEYFEQFRMLMGEAVKQSTRTTGEVGIMLSSGLDSATVAAFTEPLLKEKGKVLNSYTHVPISDYKDSEKVFGDEGPLVEELVQQYDGIKPNFIRNEELNAFNVIDKWMEITDMPYIYLINGPWLYASYSLAQSHDIKVMLSGKQGNFSISYGKSHHYYNHLVLSFKVGELIKEFRNRDDQSYYRTVRMIGGSVYQNFRSRKRSKEMIMRYSRNFYDKKFQKQLSINHLFPFYKDFKDGMHRMYETDELHNRGIINTLNSLHFGWLLRDPTLDFRVVDFCRTIPNKILAYKKKSKRLVREGMQGSLPTSILNPNRKKGTQSADWKLRLQDDEKEIIKKLMRLQEHDLKKHYIDGLFREKQIKENFSDVWNANRILGALTIEKFEGDSNYER